MARHRQLQARSGTLSVLAGGMSGAEEGALEAANLLSIPYYGYMASGYRVLGGQRAEIARKYGLMTTSSPNLNDRTKMMVETADLVLFFGREKLRMYKKAAGWAEKSQCPIESVDPTSPIAHWVVQIHIATHGAKKVFITGDREDRWPGMKDLTREVLLKALRPMEPVDYAFEEDI